jgi:Uma2 family endonuclease
MALLTRLTIEDYEKLPDALALNRELVDGELVEVSGNTGNHNALRDLIISMLLPLVNELKLGKVLSEQEFDFQGNVHGPDVSFFVPEKCSYYDGKRRVQRFVPDLVIEIVSENDKFEALMKKANRYRRAGTAEVWVLSVDPRVAFLFSERQTVILENNDEFRSQFIPGFAIRLGDLFDRI